MQIVGATVVFCMQVNRAGIHQVIHFDSPSVFDSYMQETGLGICYGLPTIAILLHLSCTTMQACRQSMSEYASNSTNC